MSSDDSSSDDILLDKREKKSKKSSRHSTQMSSSKQKNEPKQNNEDRNLNKDNKSKHKEKKSKKAKKGKATHKKHKKHNKQNIGDNDDSGSNSDSSSKGESNTKNMPGGNNRKKSERNSSKHEKLEDEEEEEEEKDPYDTGISKIEKPFDGFYVMCSGQVESAEFYGVDNIYCKYTFYYGQHWTPVAGVETAISQISRKGREQSTVVTWNFPINITFRASNAHGWPRLVLSIYSIDLFGRDIVCGYGSIVLPPFPGQYIRYCRVFKPRTSSTVQSVLAWLTANNPEFFDAKFVAGGEGRKNTQVISSGVVKIMFDISTRGMEDVGFSALQGHTGSLLTGGVDHTNSV